MWFVGDSTAVPVTTKEQLTPDNFSSFIRVGKGNEGRPQCRQARLHPSEEEEPGVV